MRVQIVREDFGPSSILLVEDGDEPGCRSDMDRNDYQVELRRALIACEIAEPLLSFLIEAVERQPPYRSVFQLANAAGRSRNWLGREWRDSFLNDAPFTLSGLLHRIQALWIAEKLSQGFPVTLVSSELGIHPRSVRRRTRRYFGRSAEELQQLMNAPGGCEFCRVMLSQTAGSLAQH